MRYCGNCGTPLNPADIAEGRCRVCGAAITSAGDVVPSGQVEHGGWDDARTFPADDAFLDTMPTRGATFPGGTAPADATGRMRASPSDTARRTNPGGVILVVAGVLVVGLLGIVLFSNVVGALLNHSNTSNHTSGNNGGSTPSGSTSTLPTMSATRPATHSTATATAATTPGAGATATTTASPTATATPTPLPTDTPQPTATPTPLPATIVISPQFVSRATCVNASASFTIANTGGGTLQWTATPQGVNYIVTPSSGDQPSDATAATVDVSNINGPGNVEIQAPYTTNSPVLFKISCV
jgi:hypothetical protein